MEQCTGHHMAIDDKEISGEGYTIISNRETGKIFLMISTRKTKIITSILHKISLSRFLKVQTITKDLANNYDWLSREIFPHAVRIADKFHVLKLGFEAMQAVRVRFRQSALEKAKKTSSYSKRFSNGDSEKELLARSRFLLFKRKKEWIETQEERGNILFKEFPEIKKAYELMEEFRDFYNLKTGDFTQKGIAKKFLIKWYKKVKHAEIKEMTTFAYTVKRHEPEILAYFYTNATNACAESLNAKIQRFLISSFGIKNRDFFHFRIKKHFSPD